MEHLEHTIIIGDNIAVMIKLLDIDTMVYNIRSDSEIFREIFGVGSFQLEKGDSVIENALIANVVHYNQPRALQLLAEIKQIM
jgi:hypothetical protein